MSELGLELVKALRSMVATRQMKLNLALGKLCGFCVAA